MKGIIKIGSVELLPEEAEKYYREKPYFVTYTKIWQVCYSQAQQKYYGTCIYQLTKKGEHFTRRGRFYAFTAADVNRLLKFPLLRE